MKDPFATLRRAGRAVVQPIADRIPSTDRTTPSREEDVDAVRADLANPVEVDGPDAAAAVVATTAPATSSEAAAARPATLVRAPMAGEVIPLSQVEDPAFAAAMVGPGVAIRPSGTQVLSPVDGTVMLVFPTKHAIGVRSDTGVELLIHVGIDTVQLKGAGFETLVAKGDIVEVGTPLMRFDPAVIEAAGYPLTTPVIVTNAKKVGQPVVVAADTVREGHDLFTVP